MTEQEFRFPSTGKPKCSIGCIGGTVAVSRETKMESMQMESCLGQKNISSV